MGRKVEAEGEGEAYGLGSRGPAKGGGEVRGLGRGRGGGRGVFGVGGEEVGDGGVEAAREVVREAGGEASPRGESHGGGGGRRCKRRFL